MLESVDDMEPEMKISESRNEMQRIDTQRRAAEALRLVLSEVSTIKLKEIRHDSAASKTGFLAYVDIFGECHTLACEVKQHGRPAELHSVLDELRDSAARLNADATPVLIAPYLAPDAQAICNQRSVAFVDLEGNARISLGEVFVTKRTMRARVLEDTAIDSALLNDAESRPPAPRVYIASNIPGVSDHELPVATAKVAVA
jgi:hypothetical protein